MTKENKVVELSPPFRLLRLLIVLPCRATIWSSLFPFLCFVERPRLLVSYMTAARHGFWLRGTNYKGDIFAIICCATFLTAMGYSGTQQMVSKFFNKISKTINYGMHAFIFKTENRKPQHMVCFVPKICRGFYLALNLSSLLYSQV